MKKGFTLIELLAVIVILAIIALIAVPIILNIIGDAKKSSTERSEELYLDALEKAVARYNLTGEFPANASCTTTATGLSCNSGTIILPVEMNGTMPEAGSNITLVNGKIATITNLHISDKYFNKTSSSSTITMSDTAQEAAAFSGTIYRNSTDTVSIGGSIVPGTKTAYCGVVMEGDKRLGTSCSLAGISWNSNAECVAGMAELDVEDATCERETITTGLTSYETDESNITETAYLKHVVVDNIVQASYACIKTDAQEDPCVQGGDPAYYGSFDEMKEDMNLVDSITNPTPNSNIDIINSTKNYFTSNGGACKFNDKRSYCRKDEGSNFEIEADNDGTVLVANDVNGCYVMADGKAVCMAVIDL